jgi:outer membrane protein assembly factor BamD (BamD/ComL family)
VTPVPNPAPKDRRPARLRVMAKAGNTPTHPLMFPGARGRATVRAVVRLLVVVAALAPASCADPARARFERAEKALLEQRMDDALAGYRSIPKDFPQSRHAPPALLRQGDLFGSYYRNYDAALEAYDSLVYNYPQAAEAAQAILRKGEIHLLQFFGYREAVAELELLRTQYPSFARMDEALILLAKAYGGLPDPARQLAVLSELAERHPDSPRALEARWVAASTLLGQGKHDEAEREFGRLLEVAADPRAAARARWGMAQALEGKGDLAGAVRQYEAIGDDWDDPDYLVEKLSRLRKRLKKS